MKPKDMEPIQLTEVEKAAKILFTKLITEGNKIPCDTGSGTDIELKLPQWYDEDKFKRGQKYFFNNRFGMMQSNFVGLITLLAEPKGLTILHNTGRSSTPETARKRYISTTLHMLSWYEIDLSPGSKSWTSLNRVRKMHKNASNRSEKNRTGIISQTEIALTTFGFMGYALVRPHLLGIKYDNEEDREALVHFWAVIGSLLGVKDEYNICLPKLAVVEMICQMCIRYLFIPLLQFESPLFKQMVSAVVEGLGEFTPFNSYDSMMYFVRRVAGIPGYQFNVDMKKETICRRLYNLEELNAIKKLFVGVEGYEYIENAIFDEKVTLYNVEQIPDTIVNETTLANGTVSGVYKELDEEGVKRKNALEDLLQLKHNEQLVITAIEDESKWDSYLNDSKLKFLSNKDLGYFKFKCRLSESCYSKIGNFINESVLSLMLYRMRKAHV